jgi:DNA modification methylase
LPNQKRLEMWPISRPKPNLHNSRIHPPEQIEQLAASLKQFGQRRPILVDENEVILTGHGLLLAAQHLGLDQVLVLIADDLTEEQKRAYLIADNQLAQNSQWDSDKLRIELGALEKQLFDVKVVGFSPEELDRIFADSAPERLPIDEDDFPAAPTRPITAVGDVWVMANHRLVCGDSTRSETFAKLMESAVADMTFADLPYGVGYKQPGRNRAGLKEIANDDLGTEFEEFLYKACVQILKVTDGAVYLCMSSSQLHTLHKAFLDAGGYWSTFIIWSKEHFTLGRSDYQRKYEPILYGWGSGRQHYWCGSRNQPDVWDIPKPRKSKLHPTMKPVALVERAIRNSCRRGGVVLDPFAGAGATLIACEKAARKARLIELEPRFVDVIVQRWEAYTGREATLEATGQSFTQIKKERHSRAA